MTSLDKLIAIRRRIALIEVRLQSLLETHETCRLAWNDLLTAFQHQHRPTDLDLLASFSIHDRIETEPSATTAVLSVLRARPDGATVEVIISEAIRLAPHATSGAVRTAISRLTAKGAIRGARGKGAVYRAVENAENEAGYTRRRRQQPVSDRIHPTRAASPLDFNAAAALLLVLYGPMTGPTLLSRLKDRLQPRGKFDLKYLESNLGHDIGFCSTDFGYWLSGLQLPEKEEAVRKASAKGSRSPASTRQQQKAKRRTRTARKVPMDASTDHDLA